MMPIPPIRPPVPPGPVLLREEPRRGTLAFDWRRELPVFGVLVASFAALYVGMEVGSPLSKSLREPREVKAGGSSNAFLRNPILELTRAEAALEIVPGKLRLGDLARLFREARSDPHARAFLDAFLARPALREALKRYMADKDARAFEKALTSSPEFAKLFAEFLRNDGFRRLLDRLAREEASAWGIRRESNPDAGSIDLARGGHLFDPESAGMAPAAARGDGREAISEGSRPGRGRRTGPGYDGQPQPGEGPPEEFHRARRPAAERPESIGGERVPEDAVAPAPTAPQPLPGSSPAPLPPAAASTDCSGVRAYDGTAQDASGVIQSCIDHTPRNGVVSIPPGTYTVAKPLQIAQAITFVTKGTKPTDPPCLLQQSCAVIKPSFKPEDVRTKGVFVTAPTVRPPTVDHVLADGGSDAGDGPSSSQGTVGGAS